MSSIMKFIPPLILTFLSCLLPVACEDAPPPPSKDYLIAGEKLEYVVKWMGIPAGEIVMTVDMDPDASTYEISIRARTNTMTSWVYNVRDNITSTLPANAFRTQRVARDLKEGRRHKIENLLFDSEGKKITVTSRNVSAHEPATTREHSAPDSRTLDSVAALFFLRTMDFSKEGATCHASVFEDKKCYTMAMTRVGQATLDMPAFGIRDTYIIEPSANFEGVFVTSGKLTMWVDCESLIPLRIKISIPIGWAMVELASSNHPKLISVSFRDRRGRR
ncbi:MAG: DUF3108 domain-containing protein [Planctomycetes bacterium]|nr:DUF3108 domain-containing protein [Planctomycetota bacterium]